MTARPGPRGTAARRPAGAALPVAFRVAASPRIGFGHLVRALHLANALGTAPRVSIRGPASATEMARRLGAEVLPATRRAVIDATLGLLIIDDPSHAAALPWLRAAQRAGVPVASFHDVGIAPLPSDLAVDGSLAARRVPGLGATAAACRLGADYAVLAPAIAAARPRRRRAARRPSTVVIGLGGGQQARAGLTIARHLRAALDRISALSRVQVLLSLGLHPSGGAGRRGLPAGIAIVRPEGFRAALAEAAVAVVAGGTTLYEACALGIPAVAVPVVPGQAVTVRRFVRAGLAERAEDGGQTGSDAWGRAAATAAMKLLANAGRRQELGRRGPDAIDGGGAARVAHAITALMHAEKSTRTRR